MHPLQQPSWFHKYQHIYAPLLFALMTLAKVFQQDFEVATSKRLYHIDANGRYGSHFNVLRFWSMKAITMIYMMGLPIYSHGLLKGMGLFILGHLVCGELLATMFIVNHVIEGVSYGAKTVQESTKGKGAKPATVNGDTQTSVNWSPGSWFWNHFSGGLSHQIEHHLFPSICHTVSLFVL
jgi:linoleoyl-CoA desaturase